MVDICFTLIEQQAFYSLKISPILSLNGLAHTDFGGELFDSKVFVVPFVFSFVKGLQSIIAQFIPFSEQNGYTTAELSLTSMMLGFL